MERRLTSYEKKLKPLFEMAAQSIGFSDYVYNQKETILLAEQRQGISNEEKSDYELAKEIVTHIFKMGGNHEGRLFM